jgi:dihydrofolate reductase
MRKVILCMHVSLDGYVCGPRDELDWASMSDNGMDEFLISDLQKRVDTMLVGRKMYQRFEQCWSPVRENSKSTPGMVEFSYWMTNTLKIVFSNTLKELNWKNSKLARTDPYTTVQNLKRVPGGDMVIFGGAALAAHFAANNLIDEYRIKLEPVVLGNGKSLYRDIAERIKLKLVNSKIYESGMTGLCYQVIK